MGLNVTTNVTAFNAYRNLAQTSGSMERSLERLSSGYRISRAADDAAGLTISEGLRSQIRGMTQAVRNAQDGISVVQTAEGALAETASILQRMRDLSVQAANDGGIDSFGKGIVQTEIGELKNQLTHIAGTTTWNGSHLVDGSYGSAFQIGADVGETIDVRIGSAGHGMDAVGLGVGSVDVTGTLTLPSTVTPAISAAQGTPTAGDVALTGDFTTPGSYQSSFAGLAGTITYNGKSFDLGSVDYSGATTATGYLNALNAAAGSALGTSGASFTGTATALTFTGAVPAAGSTAGDAVALTPTYTGQSGASGALRAIDRALAYVSTTRSDLGAVQNRFEHTINRLNVAIVNTTSSESRIRDADMATEMTTFTRDQILTQAGTAMLSQATQAPQAILKLLN